MSPKPRMTDRLVFISSTRAYLPARADRPNVPVLFAHLEADQPEKPRATQ